MNLLGSFQMLITRNSIFVGRLRIYSRGPMSRTELECPHIRKIAEKLFCIALLHPHSKFKSMTDSADGLISINYLQLQSNPRRIYALEFAIAHHV